MKLLIFGMGYTAKALVRALEPGTPVTGTTRSRERFASLEALGVAPRLFPGDDLSNDIAEATHILVTAGPEDGHDPVLARLRDDLTAVRPVWVGYLSTTGVYGDHGGDWVSEDTPVDPSTERGQARATAEAEWRDTGLPIHIFRLPGIYGPGRGPFAKVRNGTARRIVKPGQVFSRIHVDDIAQALLASMKNPNPGTAYNICDDDPAPPQDVIAHAAELLGLPVPPEIPFEEADLGPMARSFYSESKRVDNTRMKEELGVHLKYPDYRSGLAAILWAETSD
ncbi:SDR family NAD(P)-dependent oxidoreductase [Rhodobacterales bacterium HKCCE3408]|nr:SDR family NAD(P)-dependent oxidoreductase [Rhodobacterales bacterium HKCCE3408]